MKFFQLTSEFEIFENAEELPEGIQELLKVAVEAREKAYAPYSKFKVGAAILLNNGEIVPGSNQENASYPSGLCAERTAVYFAGAKFPDAEIKTLVVSAKSLNRSVTAPVPPCGACRQALAEYELKQQKPIELYFMGETGEVMKSKSVKDLLPFLFDNSAL